MDWCRQATSHYLNRYWSLLGRHVTIPLWVNTLAWYQHPFVKQYWQSIWMENLVVMLFKISGLFCTNYSWIGRAGLEKADWTVLQVMRKWLTLIPTWISNHIHYNGWDEITCSSPHFNGCTIEVCELIKTFIPYSGVGGGVCDWLSMLRLKLIHVSKRDPWIMWGVGCWGARCWENGVDILHLLPKPYKEKNIITTERSEWTHWRCKNNVIITSKRRRYVVLTS